MAQQLHCPNCGSPLKAGNAFCTNCGTPVNVPTPTRGSVRSTKKPGRGKIIAIIAAAVAVAAIAVLVFVVIKPLAPPEPEASATSSEERSAEAYIDLGYRYLREGDYDNAIIAFEKAIEIDSKIADAYVGLSEAYIATEDYDKALEVLEEGYSNTGDSSIEDEIDSVKALIIDEQTETSPKPSESASASPSISPEPTPSESAPQKIGVGTYQTMVIKSDGTLWAWGGTNYGGFGDATNRRLYPVQIMSDVAEVSVGEYHAMAIKTDGSLWAWGSNIYGQLGDGTITDRYPPVKIMSNVATVSAGMCHTMAIKTDGTLWAWGANFYGQLGDGTVTVSGQSGDGDSSVLIDNGKYSPVKIMSNVKAVSTGEAATMAVKTDGTLWAWGSYYDGKHSDDTATNSYIPVQIMSEVAAVNVDGYVIKTDGTLWGWGSNYFGNLGDGTTTDRYTPVKIMSGVVSISTSISTMAIKEDGTLWAWGSNSGGQLGDGSTSSRYIPLKIMDGVTSVCTSGQVTCALKKDGSVWTWGVNYVGQLGDGTTTDRNYPVQIMNIGAKMDWKSLYREKIQEVISKEINSGMYDDFSYVKDDFHGFILADLNFDGTPELFTPVAVNGIWGGARRINYISDNKVLAIDDEGLKVKEITLTRDKSTGKLGYFLVASKHDEGNGGIATIGLTSSSEQLSNNYWNQVKVFEWQNLEDVLGYASEYDYNEYLGKRVSEEEYQKKYTEFVAQHPPVNYSNAWMSGKDISTAAINAFLDSYVPELHRG